MLNTCLIISTALAMVILLSMIALLKIQNAIQAERIQWQQEQLQALQTQQGGGCVGAIFLIILFVTLGMVLVSMVGTAAGVP